MRVERVEAPGAEWDEFAEARAGHLGHASAWGRALRAAYGIESLFLAARDGAGRIRGILPLAHFRSLLGRLTLVSLPFMDAAGVLADTPEAEEALLDSARSLGQPLELRQRTALARAPVGETSRVDLFLDLGGDADARWRGLSGKVRNQVRKAMKHLSADAALENVGAFHKLHCARMRDLGTPPHSARFFASVSEAFGARARVFIARHGARPIGGLFAIRYGAGVYVPWSSALHADRQFCPNQLLFWEALRWAEESGAAQFDFGRSPRGGGTYSFKRSWGATERPLYWVSIARDGKLAIATSSADSQVLQLLARVWQHLPAPFCDRVGPILRQRIAS